MRYWFGESTIFFRLQVVVEEGDETFELSDNILGQRKKLNF